MIFIDTGAFLGRHLSHDRYPRRATDFWEMLRSDNERCFTTNFVLDETFTLLGRRAGYDFVIQRAKNMYASKSLVIFRPDQNDELKALTYFSKYPDQNVSFTDCISLVLMRREKIHRVFSFDRHFDLAGFQLFP